MKLSKRDFLLGVLVGFALTLGVVIVGVFRIVSETAKMVESFDMSIQTLAPPPGIPEPSRMTDLGKADYGWKFLRPDGSEASLQDFKGKVVFLNRWATWCKPCVRELSAIEALYDSLAGEGLAFVLVSSERVGPLRKFLEGRSLRVPVYAGSVRIPAVFQTPGIPATFVIDGRGILRYRHMGPADWNTAAWRKFLRDLLNR